jgi:hypothetical protein
MKSTAKAEALIRGLKDKLAKRFEGSSTIDTVREAKDAQGWPMLICSDAGNEAAGEPVIAIRIRNVDMVSKDVFDNSTFAYAPHKLEIAYELDGTNIEPDRKDLLKVEFEAIRTGVEIEIKEIADGTAVSEASMDSTDATLSIEDLFWPTKSV